MRELWAFVNVLDVALVTAVQAARATSGEGVGGGGGLREGTLQGQVAVQLQVLVGVRGVQ